MGGLLSPIHSAAIVSPEAALAADVRIGAFCIIEDRVRLGSNSAVHQFCRLGRLSCLASASVVTQDLPPFVRQERINMVADLNWDGIREAKLSDSESEALAQLFDLLYVRRTVVSIALA